MNDHFQGKTPMAHIREVRFAEAGKNLEPHGFLASRPIFSFIDSTRQSSAYIFLTLTIFYVYRIDFSSVLWGILAIGCGLCIWSAGRVIFLAYGKLHHFHQVASEEMEEIEKNRAQEREELIALYKAKGFSGDLLKQVVDVLMADKERLLKVMLEEEMGFLLEEQVHPFILGIAALLGAMLPFMLLFLLHLQFSLLFVIVSEIFILGITGAFLAKTEKASPIAAFIWNCMLGAVCSVVVYNIGYMFQRWSF